MTWKPMWKQTDLERAGVIAREADRMFRAMWSSMWPLGHCAVAALNLAPLLRSAIGVDWRVAVGLAHDCRVHAWLEDPDGAIVDPTYGQFDGGSALRVLDAHHADELGHCPDLILTLDQEEHFRRSIAVKRYGPEWGEASGWSAQSGIKELFCSSYPRIAV